MSDTTAAQRASHRVSAQSRKIFLIGFSTRTARTVMRVMSLAGWDSIITDTTADVLLRCAALKYDLIAIDVENVDVAAPTVIAQVRESGGSNIKTPIYAVGRNILPGLAEKLRMTGATEILRLSGQTVAQN